MEVKRLGMLLLCVLGPPACAPGCVPARGGSPSASAPPTEQPPAWSPDGTKSAYVFSLVERGTGNTQVMVSFGSSGMGVFAVDLPHVPLRLRWPDNAHLVISYPGELTPIKQESRARSGGDVVTVSYETYAGR